MHDLLALNGFFRDAKGCHLTVISNAVDEYVDVSKKLEIPTTYVPYDVKTFHNELLKNDVALIPYPNSKFVNYKSNNRLLEAMVRELPVICSNSIQNNRAYMHVKNHLGMEAACYYTVSNPADYFDVLEIMRADIDVLRYFCSEARKYVIRNDLLQNRGHQWAEIFYAL